MILINWAAAPFAEPGGGNWQGESPHQIAVDQGTLARWERGEPEPRAEFAVRAKRFLTAAESAGTAVTA